MDRHDSSLERPVSFPRIPASIVLLTVVTIVLMQVSSAETLFVTDIVDAIPAPEGSLRAALEKSESNGQPDTVAFLIDGGTIELVAPLPDLREGGLVIRERNAVGPTPGNAIAISGTNGAVRAFRMLSANNVIAGLDFVRFAGAEVILIQGNRAFDNTISGCGFGRDNLAGNSGAAIRIAASSLTEGSPTRNTVRFSRFIGNDAGVEIEGDGVSLGGPLWTWIHDNWFGTDPSGGPGPGTGVSIRATGGGAIRIESNRFSGPGSGIDLGPGVDGAEIVRNALGLVDPDTEACHGFGDAAIRVQGSGGVVVYGNSIACGDTGMLLGTGADRARVSGNRIGGPAPEGLRSHGIVLDGARGALIRDNDIQGNDGFGVTSTQLGTVDPDLGGAILACNSIARNAAGPINLPGISTLPPVIDVTTVLSVQGTLFGPNPGWVELFGDPTDQAGVFQGAVRTPADESSFRHRIPVLGLEVDKGADGIVISFDRSVPPNHTSTLSEEALHQTSELSGPANADLGGLAYDLIRGRLRNLTIGVTGTISLGPVQCLDSGIAPDVAVSPDVVDPEIPAPGTGFFYLARRNDSLSNATGTYDPAICLTEIDAFSGPRAPTSGDCQ